MSLKTEVAISGGGIGGLTLGLKLAQSNIDVLVLERLDAHPPFIKVNSCSQRA
ncbi:NAD(P)-binding protein [Sporosarcina globispora]|uniref:NAD(P)-binding protein n=1 Tax=Sporosarcina globispora TaxID=1459 RepID=UPI000A8F0DC1|nr:NAD(P)-binding protein [Sporosarcina globispora]